MNICIDGVNINYEIFGNGEKNLLILHGWGACIGAMAPIYLTLKDKYKVYVLDFPGETGKSDVPLKPWGVPEYGEMVKKFIDNLSIESPNVIGHSFGGRVTIYLASKYQDLFNKIVLTDSAGVPPKMTFKRYWNRFKFKLGRFCINTFVPKSKRESVYNNYRDKHSSTDYKALKTEVMRETFKKVISLDLTLNLSKITRPALIVWGENDLDTPLYMAKIIEKSIKDSGLVVLKGAGHFSYIDNSNEYNIIVANFFDGGQ